MTNHLFIKIDFRFEPRMNNNASSFIPPNSLLAQQIIDRKKWIFEFFILSTITDSSASVDLNC